MYYTSSSTICIEIINFINYSTFSEFSSKTETFASTQIEQRLPTVDCAFYEFHNITCSGGSGDSYNEELKRIIQVNKLNFLIME